MLPRNPLLAQRKLRVRSERQLMLRVEVTRQIRQDSHALLDAEVVLVVVDEDGDAAVGAVLGEPGLFLEELSDDPCTKR